STTCRSRPSIWWARSRTCSNRPRRCRSSMSSLFQLPTKLTLEVVTPEGLLLREEVDEVIAPGELGYFGVLPGHAPFLSTLGVGEIMYRRGKEKNLLTCFWGFCEVLPDRVGILAEVGERAEDIDPARAE